jgi:hypothetical protein
MKASIFQLTIVVMAFTFGGNQLGEKLGTVAIVLFGFYLLMTITKMVMLKLSQHNTRKKKSIQLIDKIRLIKSNQKHAQISIIISIILSGITLFLATNINQSATTIAELNSIHMLLFILTISLGYVIMKKSSEYNTNLKEA